MRFFLFRQLKDEVKNWWISLIVGVLFLGLGFFTILFPGIGYEAIAIMFSLAMLVSGVMEIIFAVGNKSLLIGWGWYFVLGIVDVLLGLILIFIPGVKEVVIPFVLAFWLIFRGISSIGYSSDLQRFGSRNWGWYLATSIVVLFCGIVIMFFPMVGALSVAWMGGLIFFFLGLTRIMLAFDLKRLYKDSKKKTEKIKKEEPRW
ncbi:DUF308 domain-containing protein [Bacteroidales bacterium OttesenSCG-928-A17]|nr:DUF308 domain-containing protein [Bacteroidales bacterium OttesenSCG-928-A17]